jgi:lysophospholipase L1-like esterase
MVRCLMVVFALVGLPLPAAVPTVSASEPLLLESGDTLALVGGTLIERMQSGPWLEAQLHARRPDWQLRLRNLGWSGDDVHGFARKVFETNPEKGFQRLQHDLAIAAPSVVLLAYGFAEASNGAAAVARFEPGLARLAQSMLDQQRRVILMQPFALPGIRTPGYVDSIKQCRDATGRVGQRLGVPVVDVTCDQFSEDGLLPSEAGYRQIADQLADMLVGPGAGAAPSVAADDPILAKMIQSKDELFFHRHRPQNETYLLLFRKHEQGNNAAELPQFDPLVQQAEQQIWQRAEELAASAAGAPR